MTEQEKINYETQLKLALTDAKFAAHWQEFERQHEELKQHREDMRRINERIDVTNQRIDAKFDALTNQIHNLTVGALVGFGAITVAVAGLVVSLLAK